MWFHQLVSSKFILDEPIIRHPTTIYKAYNLDFLGFHIKKYHFVKLGPQMDHALASRSNSVRYLTEQLCNYYNIITLILHSFENFDKQGK